LSKKYGVKAKGNGAIVARWKALTYAPFQKDISVDILITMGFLNELQALPNLTTTSRTTARGAAGTTHNDDDAAARSIDE